ncbi:MAG: ABC transporter substrate-binding protein [Halobacteriales archaeon]
MSDETTRRRFLTGTGAGLAVALAGCGGNPPSETEAPAETTAEPAEETEMQTDTATPTPTEVDEETQGGTLQMASPGPFQTLDPTAAKGSGVGWPNYTERLVQFPNGDLPPEPQLATDFNVSDDGITWTFELKEGVTFHNGSEFTASDVVYSWRRMAGSPNSRNKDDIIGGTFTIAHEGKTGESLENYVPGSLAVRAADTHTFEFDMESPFHSVLSQIAGGTFAVLPENAVGDIEGYDGQWKYNEFFGTAGDGPTFAGTGPFQVDSWSKGDQLTLSAFNDFHGEGPFIDGIVYTVLNSSDARFQRALNQNLDIFEVPAGNFDPEKVSIERDRGTFKVGTYGPLDNGETVNYGRATVLDTWYILFNTKRTIRPARRAIAWLINQNEIVDNILKGVPDPGYHITPPPVWPHQTGENAAEIYDRHASEGFRAQTDFGADGYPYGYNESNIEKARSIMEDAGFTSEEPYEAEFTIIAGNSQWQQIAQLVQDKARAAHISIDIVEADFGTVISKAINGEMDFFSLPDGMEWPESDNFLRFLHPHDDPSFMFTRWTYQDESKYNKFMQIAQEAWRKYSNNTGPGQVQQAVRNEAYLTIEEMNWASVQELPMYHPVAERWWYDDVEVRMHGTMEDQVFNNLRINRQ